MFHRSDAIKEFFRQNQHYEGFWDFVHESGLYDEQCYPGMDRLPGEMLEMGFDLAVQAGSKPVYEFSCYDASVGAGPDERAPDLDLYFIGTEQEILDRLNSKLQQWLQDYPQETADQKNRTKIKKMKEDAERRVKQAEAQLKAVHALEEKLG